ncbi:MAG: isoprenylcysteine carboxylmethyltransferase family protein [Xanthomonadales bacterium]|nr:isoprenylcysteine carboxylmethyltransferase family protein [Xanthomonadales bacterium]
MQNKVPPPLLMIATGALMWWVASSSFAFPFSMPFVPAIRTLVIAIGALLTVSGIVRFARLKTTVNPIKLDESTRLATTGVYRISRNPMYLGLTIMLLGWGVHLGSPVNILCIAAFVAYMTQFQIKPEETALRKLFGDEFEAYCGKVRRWI